MKQHKGLFIGIALVVVVIIIGFAAAMSGHKSSSSATTTADTSSAIATNIIKIQDYMFSPMVVKVKVGTTVTWTNQDSVHHTVTADTSTADAPNGPLIGQNESYSFTFKKAGTYTFHCNPHPYMHGTVVVTN